jgi:hypothetical protein
MTSVVYASQIMRGDGEAAGKDRAPVTVPSRRETAIESARRTIKAMQAERGLTEAVAQRAFAKMLRAIEKEHS